MAMNKSLTTKGRQTFINVGCVSPKEIFIGLKLKLMSLFIISIFVSGCSEFALLASGASIAGTQNAYVKAYNGADLLMIMHSDKSIKKHIYEQGKRYITTMPGRFR